jgi:hypothetical protein
MLAFTSGYFFESSLFNGLRAFGVKKTSAPGIAEITHHNGLFPLQTRASGRRDEADRWEDVYTYPVFPQRAARFFLGLPSGPGRAHEAAGAVLDTAPAQSDVRSDRVAAGLTVIPAQTQESIVPTRLCWMPACAGMTRRRRKLISPCSNMVTSPFAALIQMHYEPFCSG